MTKKTASSAGPSLLKIGLVSTESVSKHTKRSWDEWVRILDEKNARSWTHAEMAAFLRKKYKLTPWWQHSVAYGFEIYIGRKAVNRNVKGEWSLTTTKSLHVPANTVWKKLVSKEGQSLWLQPLTPIRIKPGSFFETTDGYFGEIRTMKAGQALRMTWKDPEWPRHAFAMMYIVPRPNKKSILVFGQERIPEAAAHVRLRARWKQALERLQSELQKT